MTTHDITITYRGVTLPDDIVTPEFQTGAANYLRGIDAAIDGHSSPDTEDDTSFYHDNDNLDQRYYYAVHGGRVFVWRPNSPEYGWDCLGVDDGGYKGIPTTLADLPAQAREAWKAL